MSYWVIVEYMKILHLIKLKRANHEKFGPFSYYEDAKKEWDRIFGKMLIIAMLDSLYCLINNFLSKEL